AAREVAPQRLGVGIEEDLRGGEPVPRRRIPWSVNAIAVCLAWPGTRDVAVPDLTVPLDERDTHRLLGVVGRLEQAELNGGRVLREEREVHAHPVPGRAERVRRSRLELEVARALADADRPL